VKVLLPLLTLLGAGCVTAGAALVYIPAGFVVGGLFCLAAGLLIEDGDDAPA